mgnify:CR=1 FL=1
MGRSDPGPLDPGERRLSHGVTLDAGPLLTLDQHDRRVIVLLARAEETAERVIVPGSALAQAIRNPARQARLSRLLRQPRTDVVPLDRVDATAVGRLLAARGSSDITDAHVAICARRAGTAVVTSDPGDVRRLDPRLPVTVI